MNNEQIAKECAEHLINQFEIGYHSQFCDEQPDFEYTTTEELTKHILRYINKATNNQKNENT